MKKIGYARESIVGDSLLDQTAVLKSMGCQVIYKRKRALNQKKLMVDDIVALLDSGDLFVVSSLDRLGFDLKNILKLLNGLTKKGAFLVSVKEGLNTSEDQTMDPIQWLTFICDMDALVSSEKTQDGLELARQDGRVGGRPMIHANDVKEKAYISYLKQKKSVTMIAQEFGISRATLYRYFETKKV